MFLGAAVFGSAAAESPAPAPAGEDFPLLEGMVWKYASNLGEVTTTASRVEDGFLLKSEAPRITLEQVLAPGPGGVMLLRGRSQIYFVETTRVYDPPLLRFPLPAEAGKRWEWEGKETVDGDTVISSRITGINEGRETITVPAGSFDCLKTVITTVSSDGTESTSVQWLARGVGPVRIKVEIEAGGLTGFLVWLLGYDTMEFELLSFSAPVPVPPRTPAPKLK